MTTYRDLLLLFALILRSSGQNLCPHEMGRYYGYILKAHVEPCVLLVQLPSSKSHTPSEYCKRIVNGTWVAKRDMYVLPLEEQIIINQTYKQWTNKRIIFDAVSDTNCSILKANSGSSTWATLDCEEITEVDYDIVPCATRYLNNCIPIDGGCTCTGMYVGRFCSHYRNPCANPNPCRFDGTCRIVETEPKVVTTCTCKNNDNWTYVGEGCEQSRSQCYNNSQCVHGRCVETERGAALCECNKGYFGTVCDKRIDFCASVYCEHGGTCAATASDYVCKCRSGFGGKHCDQAHSKKAINMKLIILTATGGSLFVLFFVSCATGLFLYRKKVRRKKPGAIPQSYLESVLSTTLSTMTSTLASKSRTPPLKKPK